VENPQHVSRGVALVELDGKSLSLSSNVPLVDDGLEHQVRVVLGKRYT
jgi:cyclic beta-1,2-glucan synthetase